MYLKTLLFLFLISTQINVGQTFLNGNFEKNAATGDLINLSNADCNAKISDLHAFGTYGDVDIINSSSYGGSGAQNGTWYLGITGGGTDIVALTLSAPLIEGKRYSISFYARKTNSYPVTPIQIGLSTINSSFGTTVFTCQEITVNNLWTQTVFTFVAPNNGRYITVQMQSGGIQDWINIDNFTFTDSKCNGEIKIRSSDNSIKLGSSATFTATGASNYTWSASETLSSADGSVISVNPLATTIYTVSSDQKECGILTATVLLTVIEPKKERSIDSLIVVKEKDQIVEEKKKEPTILKHRKKLFHSKRINGRKFVIQESLTVSSSSIKIFVWDKNRVDGDQVSIYVNGILVAENFTVTKTKKEIEVNLEPGKNIIVMHALNLGLIPPNTAALSINDGNAKAKIITLVSNLKKSGALEVIYDPLAFNN